MHPDPASEPDPAAGWTLRGGRATILSGLAAMRKNYKRKRRSCSLCKPHKMGWDKRWKAQEAARRQVMERTIRDREGIEP
jgi:hypothetical protein